MQILIKKQTLDLSRPVVMGILNVTPDSFSDGGKFQFQQAAVQQAELMVAAGAQIIDIGGESTRPGAQPVSLAEELERVIPVIEAIRRQSSVLISIDTYKAAVMRAAVAAGADMINDVKALQDSDALATAAQLQVPVCLMHMQGTPQTMQLQPQYADVIAEVGDFFKQRIVECEKHGIQKQNIILDPGFGFGKSLQHNFYLLKELVQLTQLGYPLLVGVSRKNMIGTVTGKAVTERMAGSVAAAILAAQRGAKILRVHDVAQTVDALKIVNYLEFEV